MTAKENVNMEITQLNDLANAMDSLCSRTLIGRLPAQHHEKDDTDLAIRFQRIPTSHAYIAEHERDYLQRSV
ncbi:hypothetical protein Y032_0004g1907 [Ancylostoma ceylanicum]|uniref:Uncharacterized protein n=1 Tax=Ancylostoma ceylanicum TaxID=53326 RepID=A0A016VUG0_9BILA|nr:hypothetical protein Y032_0004g1907 [Ancylostoma ceylanicum]